MKKTLLIVAHPDLDNGSLANKMIVDTAEALPHVRIRRLYQHYPDFNIDVAAEQAALLEAERIVFQFPFYWYSVPGLFKEWMDKVLAFGFAYGSEGDKLKGKELLVSTTVGGPEDAYRPEGYNRFTIETLLTPLQQLANLTGMTWQPPLHSHGMIYIEGVYNKKEEVEERARQHAQKLADWIAS